MSRREVRADRDGTMHPLHPLPPPSKCAKVLYYTWKLCSVVFSHFVMISLVVAYCVLGAVTFERLEAHYEREVKMNISQIRGNTSHSIWSMTNRSDYLNQSNWTAEVVDRLKDFENAILLEMKVRGWDGHESPEHLQWTFTGALFYSIIVITTIGYGHIAPKTQTGKVVTIFYAILGIPLMLLCLSNIGDVMASSFRFLYWRVCCYVCTRPPKRRHRPRHSVRRSVRGSTRRRRAPPALPAHPAHTLERAHSDTDCRYRDSGYSSGRARRLRAPAPAPLQAPPHTPAADVVLRTRSQPPRARPRGSREYDGEDRSSVLYEGCARDAHDDDDVDFPKISLPLQDLEAALKDLEYHQTKLSKQDIRSKSLPRPPKLKPDYGPRRDFDDYRAYEEDNNDLFEMHDLRDVDYENYRERREQEMEEKERFRGDRDYYSNRDRDYDPEDDDYEFDSPRYRRNPCDRERRYERGRSEYLDREVCERGRVRRARSAAHEPEQRDELHELEGGARARRLRRLRTVDDSARAHRYTPSPERGDWSDEVLHRRARIPAWSSRQTELYPVVMPDPPAKEDLKPVPIWLCVFLVASYIVAGTFLFKRWEGWAYLDAAYFCFITLTTIGFGDFVPAQGQAQGSGGAAADAVHSIALCSLYLLFGIALLAMSFNLVQEEVRANVATLATRLGIIKPKDHSDSDDDD